MAKKEKEFHEYANPMRGWKGGRRKIRAILKTSEESNSRGFRRLRDQIDAKIRKRDLGFLDGSGNARTPNDMADLMIKSGYATNPNYLLERGGEGVKRDFCQKLRELKLKYKNGPPNQ
ncbi:hypothetical protein COV15_01840 [Candidatus Woesearchaeota archaeon CG10_big_fil_rev_8_21_14_0_10_34_12]|nr:MAG: hypothetical protein COV15_01840 [Candidatus Woesearchaeota archaeon CG10_big_fil_rev_8_21_14_0_10_34_12]